MPPDALITTRRTESETSSNPTAKCQKALVRCMECGHAWTGERDSETVEIGRAHTAETGHTRVLIIRSVHDAA